MLISTEDELLTIPDFLDRSKWTAEDFERSRKAWDAVEAERRRAQSAERRKRDRAIQRSVAEREARREARHANTTKRARRRKQKREQADARDAVLAAVKAGEDTVGKIRKRTGYALPQVQSALRFLMKKGVVTKVGLKRYDFAVA